MSNIKLIISTLFFLLSFLVNFVHCDVTLTGGQLTGIILGCIFGAIVATLIVCFLIWFSCWKCAKARRQRTVSIYRNDNGISNTKGNNSGNIMGNRNEMLMGKDAVKTTSTPKIKSKDLIRIPIRNKALTDLGFNLYGNHREGVFIKDLERYRFKDNVKLNDGDKLTGLELDLRQLSFIDSFALLNRILPYTGALTLVVQKKYGKGGSKLDDVIVVPLQQTAENNKSGAKRSHSVADYTAMMGRSTYGSYRRKFSSSLQKAAGGRRNNKSFGEGGKKKSSEGRHVRIVNVDQINGHCTDVSSAEFYPGARRSDSPIVADDLAYNTADFSGQRRNINEDDHTAGRVSGNIKDQNFSAASARLGDKNGSAASHDGPLQDFSGRYEDLSNEDKLDLVRLSYESADKTQSTPNLINNKNVAGISAHPTHGTPERFLDGQAVLSGTPEGRLPQLRECYSAKNTGDSGDDEAIDVSSYEDHQNLAKSFSDVPPKYGAATANLVTPFNGHVPVSRLVGDNKTTSDDPRSISSENFRPTAAESISIISSQRQQLQQQQQQQQEATAADYNDEHRSLSATIGDGQRAGEPRSMKYIPAPQRFTPDYESLRQLEDKYNIDVDDYEKLLYFDHLLAIQNENLARMGISLPPAPIISSSTSNLSILTPKSE